MKVIFFINLIVLKIISFYNRYMTYLAEYVFIDGLLIEFRFGYDES